MAWPRQVAVLCYRQCLLTVRNPGDALARLVTYFGIGLLSGGVFSEASGVQSSLSLLFWLTNTVFLLPFATLALYTSGKTSFVTEHSDDLVHVSAHFVATSLIETILNLLSGLFFIVPVYFTSGMRGSLSCHVGATFLSTLVSSTCLRVVVMLVSTQDMAFVIGSGMVSYGMLLSGFFIRFVEMAPVLGTLQWTSFFRYAIGYSAQCGLSGQMYVTEPLSAEHEAQLESRLGGLYTAIKASTPSHISGDEVLHEYEYDALSLDESVGALLTIYGGLMVVLYLAHLRLATNLSEKGDLATFPPSSTKPSTWPMRRLIPPHGRPGEELAAAVHVVSTPGLL